MAGMEGQSGGERMGMGFSQMVIAGKQLRKGRFLKRTEAKSKASLYIYKGGVK